RRPRCCLPHTSRRPSLPTLLFLSSFPTAAVAYCRCPLLRPPLPPPTTSIPLLPATAAGHPCHLPSFSRYRTKSRRHSPVAPAFCSQPPTAATAALVSSSKKIVAVALTDHGRCLLPSLPAASSPRPPATSSYASSPRPVVATKPSSDAPPKPSPTLSSSSSFAFSSLCRSPRRTPLPPSSLPSRFYRSQALVCRSLVLLFFIIAGQPLPSSLATTATPLCSARTLLPLPLQPPQPPPRSRPPLPPLFLPFAPHNTTASSLAVDALTATAAFKSAPAATPPCCHRFTLLPPLSLLVVDISSKKEPRHYLFFNCCFICLLPQPLPGPTICPGTLLGSPILYYIEQNSVRRNGFTYRSVSVYRHIVGTGTGPVPGGIRAVRPYTGWYVLVRQLTGTWTTHYRAKKKRENKKEKKRRNISLPIPRAVRRPRDSLPAGFTVCTARYRVPHQTEIISVRMYGPVVLDLDETLVSAYEASSVPVVVRSQAIEAGVKCFELECISMDKVVGF
ncbi:hypothetical protein BHM03_00043879, partial [Ensete ventricosum]